MPILKSLSRRSNSSQLIQYVMLRYIVQPEKNKEYIDMHPTLNQSKLIIRHNIRAKSLRGIIKAFQENESYRLVKRKDSVRIYHTIISTSNRDKDLVTEDILKDLGKKFIELRGLNSLYIGCIHFDKDHRHIHILHSGTMLNGRSSRITKQQFHSIKIALTKYQEKYSFLVNSQPEHGKGKLKTREEIVKTVKANRESRKVTVLESLEQLLKVSKSKAEFISGLERLSFKPYYRAGRLQGILVGKMKYRLSRLGVSHEQIKSLDQSNKRLKEKQTLQELHQLRSAHSTQKNKEKPKTAFKHSSQASPSRLQKSLLDQLSRLREEGKEKGGYERCRHEEEEEL